MILVSFLLLFTGLKSNETYRFDYEEVRGLILVRASLNEDADKNFILDTGSETLIIHSGFLKPSSGRTHLVTVNGEVKTAHSVLSSIRISHMILRNKKAYPADLSNLSHFVGREITGILGLNAFDHQSVLMDIEKKQIIIGVQKSSLNNNGTVVFPLEKQKGVPVVQMTLNDKKLHFVIDSGSSAHVFDRVFTIQHLEGYETNKPVELISIGSENSYEAEHIINNFFLNSLTNEKTKMLVRDLSTINQHFLLPISGLLSPQHMDLRFIYLNFKHKEALFGLKFPRIEDIALN
jgi:hypothetical protein